MTRILLSEDEPILARNIMRALSAVDVTVVHAASAAETRTALQDGAYDLMIADISLGDGDGLDLIGAAPAALRGKPVIVMTGQDSVTNRARADRIPVAAFLAKPFALARLRELVSALTRGNGPAGRGHRGPSVVMYSHDTIGLGHMRRNSAIARALVDRVPGVSVLMLVGCPSGMVFDPVPGIDYVKLPSLAKTGQGVFQTGSLRLDAETTRKMRMRIIDSVIRSFAPDLLLVDHEPSGVMRELLPTLRTLGRSPACRTVLGLRDILDAPDRTRSAWQECGTDEVIVRSYDEVLVYGDPGFFPSVSAYGLERLRPGRVRSCGIVTTTLRKTRRTAHRRPRRVLVSGGGGRDAYPLVHAAILAHQRLPARSRPALTVVTGPLMDAELSTEIRRLCTPADLHVIHHVPDLTPLLCETDLLITMAGYNTINEALAVDCPIITVPRLGPSAEQRLRAEALEAKGLARYLRREDMTPETLAALMMAPPPQMPASRPDLDGVATAADALAALLADARNHAKEPLHA